MRVADHRGGNRLRWLAQHRFEPPWATGITIRPDGGSGSVGGMTAELSIGRPKGPESRMEFEVRYTGGGQAMTGASRRPNCSRGGPHVLPVQSHRAVFDGRLGVRSLAGDR